MSKKKSSKKNEAKTFSFGPTSLIRTDDTIYYDEGMGCRVLRRTVWLVLDDPENEITIKFE